MIPHATANAGVGRYDLHMHSYHSYDCTMSPRKIVAIARTRGLQGIAVTDHGTIHGGLETQAAAPADLLVIVGAEIHTEIGDIVGLFLSGEIDSDDPIAVLSQIKDQGGLAFLPHPLRGHKVIPGEVLERLDGYEALNSRAGWFSPKTEGTSSVNWHALHGTAALGCSDAHFYSEIGNGYSKIEGPPTPDNVAQQIRVGRTEAAGETSSPLNFYRSQFVKMVKTRDLGMPLRLARRIGRRLRSG